MKVKRVRGRRIVEEEIPPSRFDRFSRADLIDLLEATMMRSGELFRGLSHSELDQVWVLAQLEEQATQSLAAIRALQRKLDLQTF
jgi:hypothetical protein